MESMRQQVATQLHGQTMVVQFEHCDQCSLLRDCYPKVGGGPRFIDPSCMEGHS